MYLVTFWILLTFLCTENKCKSLGEQVTIESSIPFIPFLVISLSNPLQSVLLAAVPETGENVAGEEL